MNGGLVSVTTETLNQLYNYNWRTKRAHLLGSECMRHQRTVYVILKYALDTRECSHRVCCAHHARKMLALARQTAFSSNTHCQFNLAVHTNHICVKFSYSYGSLDGSRQPSQIISYKQKIISKRNVGMMHRGHQLEVSTDGGSRGGLSFRTQMYVRKNQGRYDFVSHSCCCKKRETKKEESALHRSLGLITPSLHP